ncbi:ABC transporter permease [Paracholeplasma manati]|uniref:ABC transporter permease subunit n=1 Tax=Paracholeplasma manati TaxID=591373 RepID=A0ABT2Y6R4_9MOLU|nr:ABC transporter permease subunit [Paracholeplasma manati]MCV2232431.1 ABC transporter permease subunit [Paracholeplasma manati]MDG0887983.1 ABC transporter permease subunit [Paracholeplasma manati]
MQNILTIVQKELRRFFTDRRMLITLILPGLMIFLLYSLMGSIMQETDTIPEDYVYQVYVINPVTEFVPIDQTDLYTIETHVITTEDISTIKTQIADKTVDLLIIYEPDFYNLMMAYNTSSGTMAPKVELFHNTSKNESYTIYNYYLYSLNNFESTITNKFDINRDAIPYNLASATDMSIQFVTMLVPFLLITFLFTASLSIASESIAGEKERGTITTLLTTPTKRSEIALGKIIALSITALASAASSFIGLMLSLPKLIGEDFTMAMYDVGTYVLLFSVIISTVLIFVVLISIISAYAKTIKEASSLAMPFMIIIMLVGISSMLGSSTTDTLMYFIPVYNSVQSIGFILGLSVNYLHLFITIVINLVLVGLGTWLLTRMFNSEKIMFNK